METIVLKPGAHNTRDDGMCAMEAVAYVAGEPHSDHPVCASAVIGAFMRRWNDDLLDDEARTKLLAPLVPLLVGTNTGAADEERRAWMALDWLVRTHLPAWLDTAPSLQSHATALRALPEVGATDALLAAQPAMAAAGDAARNAAWDAAWDAAGDAARNAAWDAAWDAAGDAAWAAAGDAAWAAAMAAAAGAAARDVLAPTVATLQASACDLVRRMAAVGR